MKYRVDLQNPENDKDIPSLFKIQRWVSTTLAPHKDNAEVTIRIVSCDEMKKLNATYRKKNKPTNVLSFPFVMPEGVPLASNLLGDIVICTDVVKKEAETQNKNYESHFCHMVIHGLLHLLGFDHIKAKDANIMEPMEIDLLKQFGFDNPYETFDNE